MGADNTAAGTISGKYVGDTLKAENDCDYEAVVTLDTKGAGSTTEARVNGMIAGFEEACGTIDPARSTSGVGVSSKTTTASAAATTNPMSTTAAAKLFRIQEGTITAARRATPDAPSSAIVGESASQSTVGVSIT